VIAEIYCMHQNDRVNNLKYLEVHRKRLRNNPTGAERALWKHIHKKKLVGRKFRRQFSIGNYILDFYCFEEKLAIELDGKHHYTSEGILADKERDGFLKQQGITVVRFENKRVFEEIGFVLKEIQACFKL
jgi:very-short-patch-repair endonuclease